MSRSGAAAGQAPGFSAAPRGREVRLHCSVLAQHRETCPCQTPLPPPGWTPSCVPSQSLPHIPAAVRRLLAARRELRHSNGDCTGNGTGRRVPAAPGQRWCQRLYRGAVPSAGGMQRSRHSQGQHLSPAGQLESLAQSGDSRRKQRMKSRGHLPGFWESPVVDGNVRTVPEPLILHPWRSRMWVSLEGPGNWSRDCRPRGWRLLCIMAWGCWTPTSRSAWHSTVWHSVMAQHGVVWYRPMCALARQQVPRRVSLALSG